MCHDNATAALTEAAAMSAHQPDIQFRSLRDDPRQHYFLSLPPCMDTQERRPCAADVRVFVTVHGISRNAEEHARLFAPFAERYGVVLIAPLFPEDRFAKYQQMGRAGRGERADHALHQILAEVRMLTGGTLDMHWDKLYLFGFSGGGQFVHRYAMAYPERVAKFIVGAAGWYTFPDTTLRYPRGIKPRRDLPDVRFDPERFLRLPGCVVVGERDIKPGTALNKAARVTEQQGQDRLMRAQRWTEAMNAATHEWGMDTRYAVHTLPRCGHSFRRSMRRGMGKYVFDYLFGAPDGAL